MKKDILLVFLFFLSVVITAYGQPNLIPAKPQQQPITITGATIHVGNGIVINNGYITFADGKIVATGEGNPAVLANATVINATGKHIYPGFIAPLTELGLVEIESGAKGTVDVGETGELNPHVRSIVAYNTDSKVIPTLRSNGILLAQIVPDGDQISGQSSVVQLDAWNWEDAAYKTDIAIHLNWPRIRPAFGSQSADAPSEKQKEEVRKKIEELESYFAQARAYAEKQVPEIKNLRFEAMKGLFNGSKKLFIEANQAKDILQAVEFGKKFGLRIVITGGTESYLVTNALHEAEVPVILRETQTLPDKVEDDVYLPYKLPRILQDAGLLYGLTGTGYWRQRNLPFEAGNAVPYGLTKEQALSMITLNTAKILGIDRTCGSLEPGKDATLFISEGDALDMLTLKVEKAFIQGRDINLDNLHKQLYRKFAEKYGINP